MLIIVMLLGAGAVYMVLRKIYAALWYKNLTVRIDFSKKNAVCGETIELIETVTNKKRLPLPYINLKFQVNRAFRFEDGEENSVVSDNTYRNDIFSLMMYQKVTRKIPIKCTKRGIYSIGRADMVSSGLFMNDINLVGTNQNANIVVFPKQINPELTDITFSKIMGAVEKNTYLNPDIFEFCGIREYDTHDTMNMINWKASARTGQLMVNQYKETMCQSVCILANVEPEGMLKQELLSEITISMASGLAQYLISQKINVSLISNGVETDGEKTDFLEVEEGGGLSHLNEINTVLAGIDLSKNANRFTDILEELTDRTHNKHEYGMSEMADTLYIMISQNRRKDLQKSLEQQFLEAVESINNAIFDNGCENKSKHGDAMEVKIKHPDLVYIDPPYYSPLSDNEYVRRYHFVEGLARDWKGVEIQENTVTKKFKSYPTPFSTRKGAADAFDKLFKKFSDSILIVSYSSNSQPTQDEMVALMSKYKEHVEVVPIDYTYSFGNQKHAKTNRNKVQEYLFVGFNGEDVWQKQKLQLKK